MGCQDLKHLRSTKTGTSLKPAILMIQLQSTLMLYCNECGQKKYGWMRWEIMKARAKKLHLAANNPYETNLP